MQPLIPYFQSLQFDVTLPAFLSGRQVTLYGFGIAAALGLIGGNGISLWRARRHGLDPLVMHEATLLLLIGLAVGSHVGHGLFNQPREYLANPMRFLDFSGGLSSIGGFLLGAALLLSYFRWRKQATLRHADSLVIGFVFAWFLIRVGCTINHEHPGTATRFFLGRYCRPVEGYTIQWPEWLTPAVADLRFSHCIEPGMAAVTSLAEQIPLTYPGIVAVHDMGLYEALFALLLFLWFLWLDRKPRPHGLFIVLAAALYAPLRFAMDFLRREDGGALLLGLTPAQWGMLLVGMAAAWGIRRLPSPASSPPTRVE